jgi:hypothetical protein
MAMSIDMMINFLRCPRSGTKLMVASDSLISESGERYPIIDNKPILVREIHQLHITPPRNSLISKNINEFIAPSDLPSCATIIHLGSGDVPSSDPRVISIDILPTQSADIVAEAEALPFETGSIDYLVSGAVFEHVFDPIASAAEVRRVLKEGGRFRIDTAFMQTYHGFPSHYFNMTPQAVENFIVDDFILETSEVPNSGTVLYAIINILGRFLSVLPTAEQRRFAALRVDEALAEMNADPTRGNRLLNGLPEHFHRAMAASFVAVARKPVGYDTNRKTDLHSIGVRRAYYAARVAIMLYHSEAVYYERQARELGEPRIARQTPPLVSLLALGTVNNPLDTAEFEVATTKLSEAATAIEAMRDQWITEFLALQSA